MGWIQILISIPAALVAVAFVRVGWLVAKEMDWFSPISSDWSEIPIGLRIKQQGGAFLIYLISGASERYYSAPRSVVGGWPSDFGASPLSLAQASCAWRFVSA